MSLISLIESGVQSPTLQVLVNGVPRANFVSGTVDLGFDVVSAKAVVVFDDQPSYTYNGTLEVKAGYSGLLVTVFKGFIEDKEDRWFPHDREIHGAGWLKRAQYQYAAGDWPYASQTDDAIIRDLLSKSGINGANIGQIDSAGVTLGTVIANRDVTPNLTTCTLNRNQAPWDLINEIDQMLSYKTFDTPQGTVQRKLILAVPSSSPVFNYAEGSSTFPILSLSGPATVSTIHNQVNITGYSDSEGNPADGATQTSADWPVVFNAPNSLVPNPPQYIAFPFNSQLIETLAVAENNVGPNMSLVYNRVVQEVTIEVPGNPLVRPGDSVGISSTNGDCSGNYFVEHVTHEFQTGSFITRLKCFGGGGVAGSIAPTADFDVDIRAEVDGVGVVVLSAAGVGNAGSGSGTTEYDVFCNAKSATSDPLYPDVSQLTFSWSNSAGVSATANGPYYSFQLTAAQLAANPTVSLFVTDPTGVQSTTVTKTLNSALFPSFKDPFVGTDTVINVAALNQAECTTDGGLTWYGYKPATGHIISTPERGALIANYSLFGSDDGKLYMDASNLVTAPTDVSGGNFGSHAVNCIYVHTDNPRIVLVGLDNGELWMSSNASKTASDWTGSWKQIFVFGAAVNWCVITGNAPFQMFVSMSNQMLASLDGGATWSEGSGLGGDVGIGTCYRLSYFPAFENTFAGQGGTTSSGLVTDDDTVHFLPSSTQGPSATLTQSATGGSLNDPMRIGSDSINVMVAYVDGLGGDINAWECSWTGSISVSSWAGGSTGKITVTPPSTVTPAHGTATHFYVFVDAGSGATRSLDFITGPCQVWGSPTPLGSSYDITTQPPAGPKGVRANTVTVTNNNGGTLVGGQQVNYAITTVDAAGRQMPQNVGFTGGDESVIIPTGYTNATVTFDNVANPFQQNGYSGSDAITGYFVYAGIGLTSAEIFRQQPTGSPTPINTPFILSGTLSTLAASVFKCDPANSGDPFTFPTLSPAPVSVKGLTHDAENDAIYCGDDQGRTFKGSTASQALTQQGTLPSTPGAINHMVSITNSPPSPLALLAAAVGGVYKSIDDGVTWFQMRAYNGTTMQGKMVGYADLISVAPTPNAFLSGAAGDTPASSSVVTTYEAVKGLIISDPVHSISNAVPSNWQTTAFSDASWTVLPDIDADFSAVAGLHPSFDGFTNKANWKGFFESGNYAGANPGPDTTWRSLFRMAFTCPNADFEEIVICLNWASSKIGSSAKIYLNNSSLLTIINGPGQVITSGSPTGGFVATVTAGSLVKGGTNVLAIDATFVVGDVGRPGIDWGIELK